MSYFEIFNNPIIWILIIWSVVWKGVALWKAARNNDKKWYIAMFLINLGGILEILYIFVFSKKGLRNTK